MAWKEPNWPNSRNSTYADPGTRDIGKSKGL
jgi:hypothetical protein